ncbi:hypothetical protein RYX36_000467, partial [Vicia faba]
MTLPTTLQPWGNQEEYVENNFTTPLFTSAASLSKLTNNDTCTYFHLVKETLNADFPERLPV